MTALQGESPSTVDTGRAVGRGSGWNRAEQAVALASVLLLAMRIHLPANQFAGDLLALALAPLWLPTVWRGRWSRRLLVLGGLASVSGVLLTVLARSTNPAHLGLALQETGRLAGLVAGVGLVLWARRHWSDGALAAVFGVGMLLAVRPDASVLANPWKFGFAAGATLLVLGVAQRSRGQGWTLLLLAGLALMSALNDSRSEFGILLITAILVLWQLRPATSRRRSTSSLRLAVTLLAVVAAIYNLGQALILEGALGEASRQRTLQQLELSGSVLLGGRPELGATWALMLERPLGFGAGTFLNWGELMRAKAGMATFNYDPDNGYVDRYMFGQGIELHSVFGDLWARFGLFGLALCVVVVVIMVQRLVRGLATFTASAVLIYLCIRVLWNVFFGPLYTVVSLMIIVLALALPRPEDGTQPEADPVHGTSHRRA